MNLQVEDSPILGHHGPPVIGPPFVQRFFWSTKLGHRCPGPECDAVEFLEVLMIPSLSRQPKKKTSDAESCGFGFW